MTDTIRKLINVEVKELADRVLEFTGSTEAQDRDGEIIMADGWDLKAYKKNPVFLWAHDYRQPPIGRAKSVTKGDGNLVFEIEFADADTYQFADTIYRLYKGGFLHATSVGFVPKEWDEGNNGKDENGPRRTYTKQELLELSAVPVPSNPEALITARDQGAITVKEFDALRASLGNTKGAISYASAHSGGTPKAAEDEGWDAGAEVRAADVDDLKAMCTWVGDDLEAKTSYKLPHHKSAGGHAVVWRAVAAAGAAIMGARGGVNIPEGDVAGVKAHLGKHYKEFDKVPPWESAESTTTGSRAGGTFTIGATGTITTRADNDTRVTMAPGHLITSQSSIIDELDYVLHLVRQDNMSAEAKGILKQIAQETIERLPGSDIPVSILNKAGAVLSSKNKSALEQAQELIQGVLDSAEPAEPAQEAYQPGEITRLVIETMRALKDRR